MKLARSLIAVVAAAAMGLTAAPYAATAVDLHPDGDEFSIFYHMVGPATEAPGTLLKSEPVTNKLNILGINDNGQYRAARVLYASRTRTDAGMPVSGIVIEPKEDWAGSGPRPVISYAPGTQGMADKCAPSRLIADGAGDYEQAFFKGLLEKGYAIAITDYQGLGTPGGHTYMDRVSQGHAVLDLARAVRQLPDWDLGQGNPVMIAGYSQGGGAASSAAELAGTYAPELPVKGVSAGAVPADLKKVGANLEGSLYFSFVLYVLKGLATSYQQPVEPYLNQAGQEIVVKASNSCAFDLMGFAFGKLEKFTAHGETLAQIMATEPFSTMLESQRIGRIKPAMPVMITHSTLDDVIPYAVGEQLVKDWCATGATVDFRPNSVPTHLGGAIPHATLQLQFIDDTLNGVPAKNTCGARR